MYLLAIDPGSAKCGIAVLEAEQGAVVCREIVATAGIVARVAGLLSRYTPHEVIIGRGTQCKPVAAALAEQAIIATPVDETGTTLAARRRYFAASPPRGWRRLLPLGLLMPPEPVDDWAAVLIAERYLGTRSKKKS